MKTFLKTTLTSTALVPLAFAAWAEEITIAIGHQSMCTDTYTAGIVVKELGLLEKYLPTDGEYADAEWNITWSDYSSGGPITNQMLANKLNIGVMGDYPLIVNGAKFQETDSLRSIYVAGTGYNLKGSGNAIVVPVESDIYSIDQLRGKSVSTPVGSAAWGMLLKAMQDNDMPAGEYVLKNQSPAVGAANIAAGKIDAHSDFCPWSEIMEFRGTGRKIYDGSEAGVPYLHGVVVREDFAEEYPEVVEAFLKAVIEAGEWIREDPMRAVTEMETWTGVEKEVLYLYFSKGGHLTLDPTIKAEWVDALKFDHGVLVREKAIPPLDFDAWITEDYIKAAYADMGLDYEADKAATVDPKEANAGLPAEIWHARDGVSTYETMPEFLAAVAAMRGTGAKLNATYVYDSETGLKLFGKTAFWVKAGEDYATFLRKGEAETYAASHSGEVITFDAAIADFTSEG
ncbi:MULTISPECIES: ABC transporter substrate-binding protein [Mameliella]|uniref:ABC transporter sulfonate/nitrate transport system substrate-binding protein n=1 Tax=Mameliella alba TaxID=561184 RepID=A0A0B3RX44_9RHOB|nr:MULTISPECIES: ABC transporter substrate-binding protein [Mameliella]KHQ51308.1 ABC transporter sulfonate/nitrate transport system substrate-binding protein [Mameliella alba]MDD9730343.1 ABC transporter substrate-binding protein [Mameliella sp. AT18]ODM49514.1 sulfonate ABC transporter substrate-binding protein [Ruegeria sp. PBVC088]